MAEDGATGRRAPLSTGGCDETLRRDQRIGRSAEFQTVLARGSRGVSRYVVALCLEEAAGARPSRLGVVASRKVGGAVQRTRAKRLLREVYRRTPGRPPGDLVLIARRGIQEAPWPDLVRAYRKATGMAAGQKRPRRATSGSGKRSRR